MTTPTNVTGSGIKERPRYWSTSKGLTYATTLAIAAVTLILLGLDVKAYLSRSNVYAQIQIGTPGATANQILVRNEIFCDSAQTPQPHECTFDDFWRVYKISFAEPEHIVVRKRFIFKRHTNSIIGKTLAHLVR